MATYSVRFTRNGTALVGIVSGSGFSYGGGPHRLEPNSTLEIAL